MMELLYLQFILGQLAWRLYHRQVTPARDEEVWLACVRPGRGQ